MKKIELEEARSGADLILDTLLELGISTIFGYPGGAVLPLYDAIYKNDKINHILSRHEQGSLHEAEGYAKSTGKLGVALVTSGPGATNAITGIADAMSDSVPLLVFTGQVATPGIGKDAFQEADIVGITMPITKYNYQIRDTADIPRIIREAVHIATTGRPGPVVLDFPRNAQTGQCEWRPGKVDRVRSYSPYPKLDMSAVAAAAALINNAKKPMALVGQGVELGEAQQELRDFLEKADIPAGRTLLGLSALPSDHPLNVGMLGMHGNYAPNVKQQECDVLIAIGMRFSDRVTGRLDTYAKQAKVIHLDIDPSEIGKNVSVDVPVIADCKESLPAITALLEKADHKKWRDSFVPLHTKETEEVIEPHIHPTDGPLLMGEIINLVAEKTAGNAVLVNDVGENQMFSCRYFKYNNSHSVVTSGGLGTMGFGLPAAIGATFGTGRTVCFFVGDGGLQMSIQEFGTIMEQQTPVKIILLNNNYLGNVRQWQDLMFGHRHSFTHMLNPHYSELAKAYNIPYALVTDRKDLEAKVNTMLSTEGPFFLECAVKENENILPMVVPGTSVDEMVLHLDI